MECDYWPCIMKLLSLPLYFLHYDDVIMGTMASQITSLTIVYSTDYSGADRSKHQSSASLAFVWGMHRGPVNSPHKWPVTRKIFPFDDVIMDCRYMISKYTMCVISHTHTRTFLYQCYNQDAKLLVHLVINYMMTCVPEVGIKDRGE